MSQSRSRLWFFLREETLQHLAFLGRILFIAAPLIFFWALSFNALLYTEPDFYRFQLGALLFIAGLIQAEKLFSFGNRRFEELQYRMLPVSPAVKYLARLGWVLVLGPWIIIGLFLLWTPVCQQLSLWIFQAQNYPLRPFHGFRILQVYVMYVAVLPLFIPGALIWRNLGTIRSLLFFSALFVVATILRSFFGLEPRTESLWINLGLGVWELAAFQGQPLFLALAFAVAALFLVSGYYLFRDKEIQ